MRTIQLSNREKEILQLHAEGLTSAEIADQLGIGEGSEKSHMHNIRLKLQAKNAKQAIAIAMSRGIIP